MREAVVRLLRGTEEGRREDVTMPPQTLDRRRVARVPVPWQYQITKPSVELGWVRLLDLSSEGARIEHPKPVHQGEVCAVDLVPALEWGQVDGRVVWTRPHAPARTFEGDTRVHYQSGLAFIDITPEQRVAVAVAFEILQTVEARNRM